MIFLEFSAMLGNEIFRNFCDGGLVLILLDLKWIVIPAIFVYFLRYPVSAIYLILRNWPEFQRPSRWGDRTSWIRQATYVFNLLLWLKLVFFRRLVWWTKLIIGNQQSSTSLGEEHFKIVGSLEADSKRLCWDSSKRFLVVPKVILQSITKPTTRAFLRSIVLKDWLWHRPKAPTCK